jgi:membrane-associated PAP2 superfamily phosphatase
MYKTMSKRFAEILTMPALATKIPALPMQRRQFWLTHGALPLLATILLYAWSRFSDFDLRISQWLFAAGDGHFFDNWFLTDVMHEGVRAIGYTLAYALLLAMLTSFFWPRLKPARIPLVFLVISIALGSSLVVKLKSLTNVYCPSNLLLFGGDMPLHSPFDTSNWNPAAHGGKCWPGGHSSYGFSMWAFYFLAREYRRSLALPALIAIFVYGNILGTVRVVQGAHFLSHQWWTASLCWFTTVFFYVLLLRRDLLPSWKSSATRTVPQGSTS